MKKKLAILLAGVMVITSLTACATNEPEVDEEEVTAEELISDAFDTDYVEYDMVSYVEMNMKYSGYSVDMELEMDISYECSPSVCYVAGDANIDMKETTTGETESLYEELKGYYVLILEDNVEKIYQHDEDSDAWYLQEQDTDADTYIPKFSEKMFEDLELDESEDGYEVTGLLKKKDVLLKDKNEALVSLLDATEDCDFEITLHFSEDKELESFEITIETDEDEIYDVEDLGKVSISEFEIIVENISMGDDEVEVPSSVEKNAISVGDDDYIEEDETEDTESTPDSIVLGTITDTTYENAYLGIGWENPNSNWTLLTRNNLDSVYNATIDLLGENAQQALENATVFYDMMAVNQSTGSNINIVVEKTNYSEDVYASAAANSIKTVYAQMGYTDISMTSSTIVFMNESHACLCSKYKANNMVQYQVQTYVKVDNYMVIITASSAKNLDDCKAMFDNFYRLGVEKI